MSVLSLLLGVRHDLAAGARAAEPIESAPRAPSVGGGTAGEGRASAAGRGRIEQPVDTLTISADALEAADRLEADAVTDAERRSIANDDASRVEANGEEQRAVNAAAPRGADGEPLSDAEVEQVRELEARDLEVRQHEQAHVAAGGPYVTSGPTYEYQRGPDGRRYAVGGSVGIDVSAEDTPEKTIAKARVVRQAALAPAEPSAQDLRVASQASQLEQQARAELNEERRDEGGSADSDSPSDLGGRATERGRADANDRSTTDRLEITQTVGRQPPQVEAS